MLLKLLPLILISACSTPGYQQVKLHPTPTPVQSPTPEPPKKKPPEPPKFWGCKVSNNEGRIIRAIGDDIFTAQSAAKRACERAYRNCTFLKCESGVTADYASPF